MYAVVQVGRVRRQWKRPTPMGGPNVKFPGTASRQLFDYPVRAYFTFDLRNPMRETLREIRRIHESANPRILFDEARFNNQPTDTLSDVRWSNLSADLIKRRYNHAANQTLTSFVDIAAIERFEIAYRVSLVFCDINATDTAGCAKPSFCIRRVDKSTCQSCRFLVSASRIEFA